MPNSLIRNPLIRKLALWLFWTAFVLYTIVLAPLDQPGTLELVGKLLRLEWGDLNAYVPTLFSLMGVWPMVYACILFIDDRMQRISALPSFLVSNGSGVIGMMPYLLLREPAPEFRGQKGFWIRQLDARRTGVALTLSTVALFAYALIWGDWGNFLLQLQQSHFLYLMSLDFCSMHLVFPSILGDDMARRGLDDPRIFWAVTLVPLWGPLLYLCLRPPLPDIATVPQLEV